jgi:hypothetical protein
LRRLYKNQSPKCQPFFCCWVVVWWWWVCCLLFWKKSGHTETRDDGLSWEKENDVEDTAVKIPGQIRSLTYTTWYSQSVAITQPVAVDQIRVRKLYIYAYAAHTSME